MYTYTGRRTRSGASVYMQHENGQLQKLPLRLDLYNHSPTGFEWGYGGSGPAQLALALLAWHTDDDALASWMYQRFKWDVVSKLPRHGWTMTSEDIQIWIGQDVKENGHLYQGAG